MTPRRPPAHKPSALSAARYPTLESFFTAYLHEDFVAEHGSPLAARRAFEADADAGERKRFAREAASFLEAAATLPFDTVADFVRRDLGAAWRPADLAELRGLLRPTPPRT